MKDQIKYNGAIIEREYYGSGFQWELPNYVDCELAGEDWHCTGCGSGSTIEDCKEEIDEFLEEMEL